MATLKYIELKTGYNDNGPAWIAWVKESKSGRTIYFNGRALHRGVRNRAGNYIDPATREIFWVSGVKRDGRDRHWAGSGKIMIEAAAVEEYRSIVGADRLDLSYYVVTNAIEPTEPADFVESENRILR